MQRDVWGMDSCARYKSQTEGYEVLSLLYAKAGVLIALRAHDPLV
jgi:hypothetical protein